METPEPGDGWSLQGEGRGKDEALDARKIPDPTRGQGLLGCGGFLQRRVGSLAQHTPSDGEARDEHNEGGGDRMEDARGSQADAENIVARRKSDVAADGSHRGTAQGNGLRDDAQVLSIEF